MNLNNQATTTPGMLTLNRKEIGYVLTFEKEGYKPVEVSLRRTIDGWVFGNIIFGGLVGIVIDFASGSSYQLTPGEVSTVLVQMQQTSLKRGHGDDLFVFADLEQLPKEIRERIAREEKPA